MKFLCPHCKAKYQIADEKVAGKTRLRMECRRCASSFEIRADGEQEVDLDSVQAESYPPAAASKSAPPRATAAAPTPAAKRSATGLPVQRNPRASLAGSALGADFRRNPTPPPESPKRTALDQWHVAIHDVPVGPMRRDEISAKIAAGAITAESLCWREGFDDWRPLGDVTELAALLRRPVEPARSVVPRAPAPPAVRGPTKPTPAPVRSSRSNVVPIGGRLGAAASLDLPDLDPEGEEAEPTRIAGLDLEAFEAQAQARDLSGERAPAEAPRREPTVAPTAKREPTVAPPTKREPTVAPPTKREPTVAPVPKREPTAAAAKQAPAFVPAGAEDLFASIPPPAGSAPSGAAPVSPVVPAPTSPAPTSPATVEPVFAAPLPAAVQQAPASEKKAVAPGVWIAAAGAMAFGGVLAVLVAQRMLGPATPAVAPAAAAVAPTPPTPVAPTPPVAPIEVPPEPPQVAEVPIEAPPGPAAEPAPAPAGERTPRRPVTTAAAPAAPAGPAATPAAEPSERMRRLMEAGGSGGTIAAIEPPRAGSAAEATRPRSELSAAQIMGVVNENRAGLHRCWEQELRRAGRAEDLRLDIDVEIGASGAVTSANVRGPSFGGLTPCVQRTVQRWRFPASSDGGATSFPLVLQGT